MLHKCQYRRRIIITLVYKENILRSYSLSYDQVALYIRQRCWTKVDPSSNVIIYPTHSGNRPFLFVFFFLLLLLYICSEQDETLVHVIFHCTFLTRVRIHKNLLSILENSLSIQDKQLKSSAWKTMAENRNVYATTMYGPIATLR